MLTLELALKVGERLVTAPEELATGIPDGQTALDQLANRLEVAAHRAYDSEEVSVRTVEFSNPGLGHVTVTLDVVTYSGDPMAAAQFARGLTGLADHARGPLERYLSGVTDETELDVELTECHVEQREPDAPVPVLPVTLTKKEQTIARWITGLMFVVMTVVVLILLLVVDGPISIGAVAAGW